MFHQLGLSLHTEDELKWILLEAEACGRAQVTKEYVLHTQAELDVLIHQAEARGREAAFRGHAVCPVITLTSMDRDSQAQSILVGTGGVLGIKNSAVTM